MTAEALVATMTAEDRLRQAGVILPKAPPPVAAYAPWLIVKDVLMTSGQLPWVDGALKFTGKIGAELTPEQGYEACRICALNAIAQLKDALGDLERVKRIVRIEGTMSVAPGFTETPTVLDGATDLINMMFAERGRHTRMLYTNPEMPLNCACLVVVWAEIG